MAARIVRFISPRPSDCILEIGAGRGALSVRLAPEAGRLVAIELDRDCLPPLREALQPFPSAAVVAGDVLSLDLAALVGESPSCGRIRAVGNLPYNIATAVIERLLGSELGLEDLIFLVQREVAQRIAAQPATREYGYFSVFCQHRAGVDLGFSVSPGAFSPPPKVTSTLVRLRPKPSRDLDDRFEEAFATIAKAAFAYRRKTIGNAFARSAALDASGRRLLAAAAIDPLRRAEELSVSEYERLAAHWTRERP